MDIDTIDFRIVVMLVLDLHLLRTKLRLHVGNGYRVPSLYERFGSYFFLGTFFPLGNPQLKPERSIAVDGGVEQYLANERVKLTGTLFTRGSFAPCAMSKGTLILSV